MPPEDEDQPSTEERTPLLAWLDENLLEHTPFGGTLPRRLSVAEYRATIRDLFNLPDFELPVGFPKDSEYHGFNNVGMQQGLTLHIQIDERFRIRQFLHDFFEKGERHPLLFCFSFTVLGTMGAS